MGKQLHKLGAFAFRHKWWIVSLWIVILGITIGIYTIYQKPTSSTITIPGTEAQKTIDDLTKDFPDAGAGSARVVIRAADGKTVDDYRSAVFELVASIDKVAGVKNTVNPFDNTSAISKDKTIAYVQIQLDKEAGSIPKQTSKDVESAVDTARKSGLAVETGGDLIQKMPGEFLGLGEISGVVLALFVLVLALGSIVAAGLPIIIALITVGISVTGLFSLSQLIDINSATPALSVMLGLAVGIDYSLFIINRYRAYLLDGYSYAEAAAKAVATAGNAVVFAAGTVFIALAALSIVNIPFITTMGLAGAATVAIAAMVSVSLIPALLGIVKDKIFGHKTRKKIARLQHNNKIKEEHVNHKVIWYRWGKAISKHPIIALATSITIIAAIALPVTSLRLGLPTDEYAAASTTQHKSYVMMDKGFGVGYNGPLIVLVKGLPEVSDSDREAVSQPLIDKMNQEMASQQSIMQTEFAKKQAAVTSPAEAAQLEKEIAAAKSSAATKKAAAEKQIDAAVEKYAKYVQLKKISDKIAKRDGIDSALPAMVTNNGSGGVIQVVTKYAPSSQEASALIKDFRSESTAKSVSDNDNVTLSVTGTTAIQNDINQKLSDALPVYLITIVGLSLLLLIIAFRSIIVPIKATLGYIFSVLAMLGGLVAVFQWGWFGITDAPGPIVSFIPMIALGILFGLAMDYEFFLVSSMHEKYHQTKNAKLSVLSGFGLGSRVVTAAAVIMISVFSGFVSNADDSIRSIGFALGLGVLIDAFLVRMTIVPAVMTLLGKSAWWIPRWLDKILPHVSVEGEEDIKS